MTYENISKLLFFMASYDFIYFCTVYSSFFSVEGFCFFTSSCLLATEKRILLLISPSVKSDKYYYILNLKVHVEQFKRARLARIVVFVYILVVVIRTSKAVAYEYRCVWYKTRDF